MALNRLKVFLSGVQMLMQTEYLFSWARHHTQCSKYRSVTGMHLCVNWQEGKLLPLQSK